MHDLVSYLSLATGFAKEDERWFRPLLHQSSTIRDAITGIRKAWRSWSPFLAMNYISVLFLLCALICCSEGMLFLRGTQTREPGMSDLHQLVLLETASLSCTLKAQPIGEHV